MPLDRVQIAFPRVPENSSGLSAVSSERDSDRASFPRLSNDPFPPLRAIHSRARAYRSLRVWIRLSRDRISPSIDSESGPIRSLAALAPDAARFFTRASFPSWKNWISAATQLRRVGDSQRQPDADYRRLGACESSRAVSFWFASASLGTPVTHVVSKSRHIFPRSEFDAARRSMINVVSLSRCLSR